jgi:hypothetical protein
MNSFVDYSQATAIAYPVSSIKSPIMELPNDNSIFLERSSFASDAIEASGNFFSQVGNVKKHLQARIFLNNDSPLQYHFFFCISLIL